MKKDLITVVLPTYNSEDKVELTLDSIISQSYSDIELIVCDDCSKDKSVNVVERVLEKNKERFKSVTVIENETNLGTVKNVQQAYRIAKGRIIKPLAAGDLLYSKDTLETIYQYFKQHNPLIACGLQRSFNAESGVFKEINFLRPRPEDYKQFNSYKETMKKMLFLGHFATGAGLILNKDLFSKYNYFLPEDIKYTEDILQLWLTMDKVEVKIIEKFIIWYEYGTGISTSNVQFPTKVDIDQLNFYKWLRNKYINNKEYVEYLELAIKMKELGNSRYSKIKRTILTLKKPEIFRMKIRTKLKENSSVKNLKLYIKDVSNQQGDGFKDRICKFYNV